MNKTYSVLKTITLITILILLVPIYASAEAGKGISDGDIYLALGALVVLLINQVFLSVTSLKKIIKPEVNSSILQHVSLVIGIIIFAIYSPNKGHQTLYLFELFITIPFLLGIISFLITIFNWIKKKNNESFKKKSK